MPQMGVHPVEVAGDWRLTARQKLSRLTIFNPAGYHHNVVHRVSLDVA